MNRIISTIGLCFVGSIVLSQNRFNISQYMAHQPFINVAAQATLSSPTLATFYRAQWVGLKGSPNTFGVNFNTPIAGSNHAVGMGVINDRIGVNSSTEISVPYTYRLQVSENYRVGFGVSPAITLVNSQFELLDLEHESDPNLSQNINVTMPNASAGLYFYAKKFYLGYSLNNLLSNGLTNQNIVTTPLGSGELHHSFQGGLEHRLNQRFRFNASTLFKITAGVPLQMDLNLKGTYNDIVGLGVSYRTNGKIIGLLYLRLFDQLNLGYSYDLELGSIRSIAQHTHELSVVYSFKSKKTQSWTCPSF